MNNSFEADVLGFWKNLEIWNIFIKMDGHLIKCKIIGNVFQNVN